jgi:putative DNA methylase
VTYKKKLIEVALPLDAINKASTREKALRHGHPSTLHQWWSRKPLATARAVIFAQMVDDPSAHPDIFKTEKAQEKERQRLFCIIEDLVKWENTTNEKVLQQARDEIWQSWRYTCAENSDHPRAKELFNRCKLPGFHDPFAGGGSLPLEAQRLGLESYASDLNPVAVLINKAMIEIPPKFIGKSPVNPQVREEKALLEREWLGVQGLAEDVSYYGRWMRDEAEKRIGQLYPKVEITEAMMQERPDLKKYMGQKLTVIAWLWARTVKSPNPAFAEVDIPLVATYVLASKPGKEAYVEPVIEGNGYYFTVKMGKSKDPMSTKNGTKLSRGANFQCLMSGAPIASDHIYSEGIAGRMGARLMAIVAKGDRGRVYLEPTQDHEEIARQAQPDWKPEVAMPDNPRWFSPPLYGLKTYGDLFTPRQLVALTTFIDLLQEARDQVILDAHTANSLDSPKSSVDAEVAKAYADAVAVHLAFAVNKSSVYWNNLCPWLNQPKNEIVGNSFSRQAIMMAWGYAEASPFSQSGGNIEKQLEYIVKAMLCGVSSAAQGFASQSDVSSQSMGENRVISTDPPYYDNIGYADLSDFFYVWLRRSLKPFFPALFATISVPKAEELVATPYRHGGKDKAEAFFLKGMMQAMHRLAKQSHPAFPVTIYYAFKQTENDSGEGATNTGWDTFLAAVIEAGFAISGTWPMRTERPGRMNAFDSNALASSIVLVCRKRSANTPTVTRREFVATLKAELPKALANLQAGNIAPVDLAQAAIGPGMAVFTRYSKILDAEGKPLSVRQALALINQILDEVLVEQEGDFDADTRWAITWLEQVGFGEGEFGPANILATAKNNSVQGLEQAGILISGRGKVRLLKPNELPTDWDPDTDKRLTSWEMVHHLIHVLETGGESAAAKIMKKLGSKAEIARELCYRLYNLCERKKWAKDAISYNGLVQSWPEITRLAREDGRPREEQTDLFDDKD